MTTAAIIAFADRTIAPPGRWTVDPAHSSVEFAVKHLMIATVKGRFREFEGALQVADTDIVRGHGTVKVETLDSGDLQRDGHLLSSDFFDVDRHPEIRFTLRELEPDDELRWQALGEITIRGKTQPITLEATVTGRAHDPWGAERLALELTGELDRRDFGLSWNQVVDAGPIVGNRVRLTLALSLVRRSDRDGRSV